MRLSIVIPVRNDPVRLRRCLASIKADVSSVTPEIVVADNGSTDETAAVARAEADLVLSLPGLRVGELRNRGFEASRGDLVAFVDADHELDRDWVRAVPDVLSDGRVAAAGALYETPPDGTWVQRAYGILRGSTRGRDNVSWLGSGNLVVRKQAFAQVGGFDVSLVACEDVDLCKRLRAAGWEIVADERLRSVHFGDPATLGALFRAERWRGRNNARVSLRPPVTFSDLASLLVSSLILASLVALASMPVVLLAGSSGRTAALLALFILVGVPASKTLRAAIRSKTVAPLALLQLGAVVLTYEVARALALVSRAGHHRK